MLIAVIAVQVQLIGSSDGLEKLAEDVARDFQKLLAPESIAYGNEIEFCQHVKDEVRELHRKMDDWQESLTFFDIFEPYLSKYDCEVFVIGR